MAEGNLHVTVRTVVTYPEPFGPHRCRIVGPGWRVIMVTWEDTFWP